MQRLPFPWKKLAYSARLFWRFSRCCSLRLASQQQPEGKCMFFLGGIFHFIDHLWSSNATSWSPSTSPTMSNPTWAKLITFCVQGDALLLTRSTRTRTLVGKYSSSILGENPSKIPWGQMAHPRLNDLPKTESAISTQMVSYSIASLAFVQPRTPVALLGIQNMIWAWRGCHDSAERLPQLAFERLFSLNCGGAGTQERNATKPKVLGSILIGAFFCG